MAEEYKELSLKSFLSRFEEIHKDDNRRFCFILGAGASVSSGISSGATLAKKWLDEIKTEFEENKTEYNIWAKKIDTKNPANSYPEIYEKRFGDDPISGFHFIETQMENKSPSYGYSVLAQILATTRHNVVITTNFDDLIQEALYTYTKARPLVCGHESLASFATPKMDRPLIIKIHRDRLLQPKSDKKGTDEIDAEWQLPLSNILSRFTPIFIGYGGNDGSLMKFLSGIKEYENIFWFERGSNVKTKPNKTISKLLSEKKGKLIYTQGFDDLMFLMRDRLNLPTLNDDIIEVAKNRKEKYENELSEILKRKKISGSKEEKAIAKDIYAQTEEVYKSGLELNPNDPHLYFSYASFLSTVKKDMQKAEEYYKKAIRLNPNNATYREKYAIFLTELKKDPKIAEENYIKAIELNSKNADYYCNYAAFLFEEKDGDKIKCKNLLLKAIELAPNDSIILANYAEYLRDIDKDYIQAKIYFEKSLKISPSDPSHQKEYKKLLELMSKE
jgi:tetratricopeptide (TPR) repeat protein